jgi:glycosyltransferase involved in cell wall biosynthesis
MAPASNARLDQRHQADDTASSPAVRCMRERIRVVFLIRALDIGGAQRQLMALARSLDQRVFEVTVLTFYGGGALVGDLRGTGVRVIALDKKSRWDLIGFLARLVKACRSIRPQVLHSYLPGQNLVAIFLKPFLRGTRMVWGIRASALDPATGDWLSTLNFRLQATLSRLADLIIFNSNAGKQFHLAQGVEASRAVVIHNGVDTASFCPNRRAGLRLRSSWQVPEGALLIGLVGRIVPVKDCPTFIQAAARLAQIRPEVRFVCVGSGSQEYMRSLQSLATALGLEKKLIWPGELIGELPDAYNAINIYCSSSYAEGTSNVILEAMACGVPCVVSDVGDSRMIVGETGVVVPSRDAQALADGLERMARRLAVEPQLGIAARERIVSSFSIDSLARKTAKALTDLL